MNIEKVIKKYDIEHYINMLIFKNNAVYGIYHNISHYLDVICKVDTYCTKEGFDKSDVKNLIIASVFHDFNYIPSKTIDENVKVAVEGFIKHSMEDKTTNVIILYLIANINYLDKMYGTLPKSYEEGIKLIRAINDIGYYLSADENDIISYITKKSQEFNQTMDIVIESEIKKIEKFDCKFKSIRDDLKSNKPLILPTLDWLLKLYNEHQKSNTLNFIEGKYED